MVAPGTPWTTNRGVNETPDSAAGRVSVRITLVSTNQETWSGVTSTAKVWNSLSESWRALLTVKSLFGSVRTCVAALFVPSAYWLSTRSPAPQWAGWLLAASSQRMVYGVPPDPYC